MRKLLVTIIVVLCAASPALARTVGVRGGYTRTGSYRQPHYRTSPNRVKADNWSAKGNMNPYNGKQGTKNPY